MRKLKHQFQYCCRLQSVSFPPNLALPLPLPTWQVIVQVKGLNFPAPAEWLVCALSFYFFITKTDSFGKDWRWFTFLKHCLGRTSSQTFVFEVAQSSQCCESTRNHHLRNRNILSGGSVNCYIIWPDTEKSPVPFIFRALSIWLFAASAWKCWNKI